MQKVELRIHGLDCAEEVATLKSALEPVPGVDELAFDILNSKITVTYAAEVVSPPDLITAVNHTGLRAEFFRESADTQSEGTRWDRWRRTILTATSGILIVGGLVMNSLDGGWRAAMSGDFQTIPITTRIFYLLAVIFGSWTVAPKAWLSLRRLSPDMNLLMSVAVAGALFIGEWFEAATVAFLFALALSLESWSVSRARKAIATLMEIAPLQARIIGSDNNERLVPVSEVPVGTRIIIKPGEKFPLDGKVFTGETTVNQAPITGESMPIPKKPGDEVFAGTINEDGAVEVLTVKPAADSTLSQIIKMVRDAQSKRSPSEQWVERFAHYYTPLVMLAAIVVAVVPPLLGGSWTKWFYEALVLLVIACPCALVISTPVSIVAALVAAAKHGILIKGGLYVEMPSRIEVIAMDKTGTITEGKPQVNRIVPLSGHSELELLGIATAIELRSEHPLARAITQYAKERNIRPSPVTNYQALKGKGATAHLDGRQVWIGSHRYLEERGQETPAMHQELEALSSHGNSVVVIGENEHVCGFIALADNIRANARGAIDEMRVKGVKRIIMLTGDNSPTAEAIAKASGVDEFRAELLPQDKIAAIEELSSQYKTVAMVGDGVNDAPALARSNLGIAMGTVGTDAALETADIALMTDDLSRLPWLIDHSHRTLSIIRQNIIAALSVKLIFVMLTLAGHASLWAAIAADTGMSLLVVFNALRLLHDRSSE